MTTGTEEGSSQAREDAKRPQRKEVDDMGNQFLDCWGWEEGIQRVELQSDGNEC